MLMVPKRNREWENNILDEYAIKYNADGTILRILKKMTKITKTSKLNEYKEFL